MQADHVDRLSDAARVVGYLEYGSALKKLTSLAKTLRADEFQAMDMVVRDDPHYDIFLQPVGSSRKRRAGEDGKRSGLAAVIALARIEYASILAAFSRPQVPFPPVPQRSIDRDVFDELLLESALQHAQALAHATRKTPPRGQLLPLYGRALLAVKTAQAARQRLTLRLSAAERTELHVAWQTSRRVADWLRQEVLTFGGRRRPQGSRPTRGRPTRGRPSGSRPR